MYTDQGRASLVNALRMRCPLCGHRPISHSFGEIVKQCPGCGYEFEQGQEGYYVGALIMNMVVTLATFIGTFALLAAVTWPDVPWTVLTYVLVAVMIVVPTVFYPRSKTLWIWADLRINPYEPDERPGR